ncbi:MAG TPA: hypothetical protein VND93_31535 [Myxococcales bacterium]|nr:hypothetical protein [Myxococcales bacterium]
MTGRALGIFSRIGGLFGGGGGAYHSTWHRHGPNGAAGGPGFTPPGQGGVPPGQAAKGKTSEDFKQQHKDNYAPQQAPKPVDIQPRPTGEKTQVAPEAGGPPAQTGKLGPARKDPLISQFQSAPDYPNAEANCAPAVGAMVARSVNYGQKLSDADLIKDLGQAAGTDATGTSGNGVINMFEHMNMETSAAPGANMDFVRQELAAGHHAVALGDYYELPDHQSPTSPTSTSGHYVDITRMNPDGSFEVNDPAGTAPMTMTAAQLQSFISSAPGGGFVISAWQQPGAMGTVAGG